jgi:hypothetical protein
MKNGLYRVEVVASFPASPTADTETLPDADTCTLINDVRGMFFAKMHPVKITTVPARGCVYCNEMQVTEVIPYNAEGRMHMRLVRYCFNCGRNLQKKEGRQGGV